MLEVVPVPAFQDNYLWLVHDSDSGEVAVVDPGDGAAVLLALKERSWRLGQIWNTHWHPDHTGGNHVLKDATGCTVSGPDSARIPGADVALREGSQVRIGAHVGRVVEVPGHTLDHIAIVFDDDGLAFVGDTLFAMGCGRLFEGTPDQMYGSLQKLAGLPGETRLFAAHEYTLANARFAAHAEPGNDAIAARLRAVEAMRAAGEITLPTTVAQERSTNPFLRAADVATFTALRARKDSFG